MSKLRLLIIPPGRTNTHIPVTVEDTASIGTCIASLVDRLGLPTRDGLGTTLAYTLRLASTGQPLDSTLRFVDTTVRSSTQLLLTLDGASMETRPIVEAAHTVPYKPALVRHWKRRSVLWMGNILALCALSGLGGGIATAFAQRALRPGGTQAFHPTPSTLQTSPNPGMLSSLVSFQGHQQTVRALAWSPDGTMLASGGDDMRLLLWTPDGQVRSDIPHAASITALAWSPTGQRLVTGAATDLLFLDAQTGKALAPRRTGHTATITGLIWSEAQGDPVVSVAQDRRADVWETQTYHLQAMFTQHDTPIESVTSLHTLPTIVASASSGGAIRVWRLDTLQEVHPFYQDAPLAMHSVAFAPKGMLLAVGGDDGQVRIWNDGLHCTQVTFTNGQTHCSDPPVRFRAHTGAVRAVAWSPDGEHLATAGDDGMLSIWKLAQGQMPSLLAKAQHKAPVLSISWAPDSRRIAAASGAIVMIWNVQL